MRVDQGTYGQPRLAGAVLRLSFQEGHKVVGKGTVPVYPSAVIDAADVRVGVGSLPIRESPFDQRAVSIGGMGNMPFPVVVSGVAGREEPVADGRNAVRVEESNVGGSLEGPVRLLDTGFVRSGHDAGSARNAGGGRGVVRAKDHRVLPHSQVCREESFVRVVERERPEPEYLLEPLISPLVESVQRRQVLLVRHEQ